MKHKKTARKKKAQRMISAVLALAMLFAPFFADAQTPSEPDIPKIIPRSAWGADGSDAIWPVEYSRVEKFVIHHTASSQLTPDSNGSGEYKNMVKNIYTYHTNNKTWYDDNGEYTGFGDVGYNYLIDPNGNIYEGRSGGNSSVGGHVLGYNKGSIGISVLGRYEGYYTKSESTGEEIYMASHPVTSAIKKSLESLVGWLAANNGIDVSKVSDFLGKSIDGVVGHKDLGATKCPGSELYKELDSIQASASDYVDKYKNYAYQIGGDKAIYILEDGYKIKFESVDKLPSAYKDRIIKPISKSQLDAYRYKNVMTYPDGSSLQEFDNPMVYYLENGLKRAMNMSGEEFVKMGFKVEDIKKVFASDLKIYKDGKIIKYGPDRNLIKDKNGNVYLVEKGKIRKFTSPQLFEYLNYKWKDIKEDSNIGFYLEGLDMIYPDGTLVAAGNSDKIYFLENQQRREISSDNLLKALGYKKTNVILATEDELNHFPVGGKMTYPDGNLIKADNSPVVYLVQNGKRKEFTSAVLFEKLGYKWNDIIGVRADEINNHSQDGRVLYPDGTLIKSIDQPTIYFIKSGKKLKIISIALFEKRGFKWSDVISIRPDELQDYPNGGTLTYPDGMLIKKENDPVVYRIENGERKEFTSLALFEATKSKWSDVVTVNNEELLAHTYSGAVRYPENTLLRQAGDDKIYVIKNEKAEWIKTAEDFKKAKYKWQDVIEIAPYEMSLYPGMQESIKPNTEDNRTNNSASIESNDKKAGSNDGSANSANNTSGNNPNIRIAIYSTTSDNVTVTANGNYTVNYYNPDGTVQKTESKSPNEQTTTPFFNSSSYVKFVPASRDVILQVLSYHDLSWNKTVDDNEFRGNIEIKYSSASGKLWAINELPLEDYVNGIAEALNDSPEEYLKAFGVVARTYAMYYFKKGGKHSSEPFHLKNSRNGNGNDQIYKGYNFEKRAPKIVAANKSTQGYTITYDGKPIVAAYSSDSGGVTKNGCEILGYCGDNYAYLKGGIIDPLNTEHSQDKISASHGVGMSAVGAYQMAISGGLWQEIIKYYYPGVGIENLNKN